MKEVKLKIPEEKLGFFRELVKELGFEMKEGDEETIDIPEEHKAIVRERIKKSRPEDLVPWEEARKQFKFKPKS